MTAKECTGDICKIKKDAGKPPHPFLFSVFQDVKDLFGLVRVV